MPYPFRATAILPAPVSAGAAKEQRIGPDRLRADRWRWERRNEFVIQPLCVPLEGVPERERVAVFGEFFGGEVRIRFPPLMPSVRPLPSGRRASSPPQWHASRDDEKVAWLSARCAASLAKTSGAWAWLLPSWS